MGQLEPGAGKGIGKRIRVLVEALGHLAIFGVHLQREIGGEHDRRVTLGLVMRVRDQVRGALVAGDPLDRTAGAARLHPVEAEQIVEILGGPSDRVDRPRAFQPAGHRIDTLARAALVDPADTLLFGRRTRRIGTDALFGLVRAMRLAEGVPACDQRDGFLVVHRHAAEGFANVLRCRQRIGITVRAFGIDVDQAHLHGSQRLFELAIAMIAISRQELLLAAPIDLVRLPVIGATAGKAEGLEAHRFERDVTGQHHQVGPAELAAVLLLDRPEQTARAIEIGVVGPAVERLEPLLTAASAAATIGGAIGARAVPRHADEERTVMAVIRRPPVLRGGHQRLDVGLDRREVERLELLRIVEIVTHRVRLARMLAQRRQVEPLGPPVLVRIGRSGIDLRLGGGLRKGGRRRKRESEQGNHGNGGATHRVDLLQWDGAFAVHWRLIRDELIGKTENTDLC